MSCFRRRKGDEGTSPAAARPDVLRPLGALEQFESAMHSIGVYYGCGLTCRFAIPAALRGGGAQSEDALRGHFERAVALAVLEHPLLQVGLVGESSKAPVWVRLDRIDLHNHIQWQTVDVDVDFGSGSGGGGGGGSGSMDAALEDVIKVQHDTPYPDLETRPGWKMVVLRSPDLDYLEAFFGLNHANADGESAKIFQQTLLEKLNLLSSTTSSSSVADNLTSFLSPEGVLTLPPMTASVLTPAHESLVDLTMSLPWILSIALIQMFPARMRSHPLRHLPWAPQRPVPVRTALRLVHVDAAALRRVLDACRGHNTTLTGLVQAMSITSLAMQTRTTTTSQDMTAKQKTKSPPPPPLVLGTPVSMRRYMQRPSSSQQVQDPERTMVNSVTYCFHRYHGRRLLSLYELAGKVVDRGEHNYNAERRLEDALWEQASRVRRQLEDKLAKGTRNDLTALMRFIPDFRGRMAEEMRADRPRDVTLEVSNLGVIDGSGDVVVKPKTPLQQRAVKDCCSSSTSSAVAEKAGGTQDSAVVVGEEQEDVGMESREREKWMIERAMFTQSGIPHGVAIVVSLIAVKGKGLTIAVNWQSGLVDEGVAAGLAADLEAWLGSLGRGEHLTFSGGKVKAG
ncbi:hypothetical protein PG993_004354 [Apiospora rasikravindrae]|uniref:Alcohol acetyltransferase n=1 Tax=Apiospora rasikravindrae TaxID=990691 RepID=A0ABR1TEH7_9PEZI